MFNKDETNLAEMLTAQESVAIEPFLKWHIQEISRQLSLDEFSIDNIDTLLGIVDKVRYSEPHPLHTKPTGLRHIPFIEVNVSWCLVA